jgi:hypothetical protein
MDNHKTKLELVSSVAKYVQHADNILNVEICRNNDMFEVI